MKSFLKVCTICLVLTFIIPASVARGQFFFMENPLIGEKAPDFLLKTINGDMNSMSEFRGDDRAIIFFWATWCPHCRVQLKELRDQGDDLKNKGIKLILVDIGEGMKLVQNYIRRNNIPFDVFLDEDQSVAEAYSLVGVPTFIFVKEDGTVKAVEHGLPKNYENIFVN